MSSPSYYDDGNFAVAAQNGPWRFAFPFSDHGDATSFTATRAMRRKAQNFVRTSLMTSRSFSIGATYLVGISEARDVGCGLLEWEETWASVPVTRTEYGSIAYTLQDLHIISSSDGQSFDLLEYTSTRDARFVFEYSLNQPLPRRLAPVVVVKDQTAYGFGGWGTFPAGAQILAQDTQSDIYMGRIYQRKSVFIEYHPFIELI